MAIYNRPGGFNDMAILYLTKLGCASIDVEKVHLLLSRTNYRTPFNNKIINKHVSLKYINSATIIYEKRQ